MPKKKPVHIAICCPQTAMVHKQYTQSLAAMCLYIGSTQSEIENVSLCFQGGSVIANVRNQLTAHALMQGATHLLWIDADHDFPRDTAHRLLAHGRPWVGINASTRQGRIRPTALKTPTEFCFTTPLSKGLEKVHKVGIPLALIERRVFEAIEPPWFMHRWVKLPPPADVHLVEGEDIHFCNAAREKGFVPMIDHDLSRDTNHFGSVGWNIEDALIGRDVEGEIE